MRQVVARWRPGQAVMPHRGGQVGRACRSVRVFLQRGTERRAEPDHLHAPDSRRPSHRDGSPMAEDSCCLIRCDGDRRLLLPIPTSREFSTLNSRRQPSASPASSAYGDVRRDASAARCISASRRLRPRTPSRRTSGAVADRPRAGTEPRVRACRARRRLRADTDGWSWPGSCLQRLPGPP